MAARRQDPPLLYRNCTLFDLGAVSSFVKRQKQVDVGLGYISDSVCEADIDRPISISGQELPGPRHDKRLEGSESKIPSLEICI
ncbi:MAG: hypothetical protein HZA19_03225 [Nitrospirae bacterium]|nr:hypothetical protein [Nitrospirota bacterium]